MLTATMTHAFTSTGRARIYSNRSKTHSHIHRINPRVDLGKDEKTLPTTTKEEHTAGIPSSGVASRTRSALREISYEKGTYLAKEQQTLGRPLPSVENLCQT